MTNLPKKPKRNIRVAGFDEKGQVNFKHAAFRFWTMQDAIYGLTSVFRRNPIAQKVLIFNERKNPVLLAYRSGRIIPYDQKERFTVQLLESGVHMKDFDKVSEDFDVAKRYALHLSTQNPGALIKVMTHELSARRTATEIVTFQDGTAQ